jgi:hypothetical protein
MLFFIYYVMFHILLHDMVSYTIRGISALVEEQDFLYGNFQLSFSLLFFSLNCVVLSYVIIYL